MMSIEDILDHIRSLAAAGSVRITIHAHEEMVEEDITLDEIMQAVGNGRILEDYPEHRRGSCCLLYGVADNGRPLHIVCTTSQPVLILITVYEPKPPKWVSPIRRRG